MTRPSSERDGSCVCDYNPSTTDGPQEDCPFHGRPYAYWIERGDALAERIAAVEALAAEYAATGSPGLISREVIVTDLRDALSRPIEVAG